MPTHPLWQPFEIPTQEEIDAARLRPHRAEVVEVVAPDPTWPGLYGEVRDGVRAALGDRVVAIEHVGSTAVPQLPAKPVIDIDLTVADPADEAAYVPALEAVGFVLRVREPHWQEHRMLWRAAPRVNLHVWPPGALEPRRHVAFRDWLRSSPAERAVYAAAKHAAADRGFTDAMLYNNAKAEVVYDLYERIFAADPAHEHDPRPR